MDSDCGGSLGVHYPSALKVSFGQTTGWRLAVNASDFAFPQANFGASRNQRV